MGTNREISMNFFAPVEADAITVESERSHKRVEVRLTKVNRRRHAQNLRYLSDFVSASMPMNGLRFVTVDTSIEKGSAMRFEFRLLKHFQRLIDHVARTSPRRRQRLATSAPADVEILEPRQMLSAGGPEIAVSPLSQSDASDASVAMDKVGDQVVVWRNSRSDGSEIDGQVYGTNGKPIGNVFQVASPPTNTQTYVYAPSVAMDARGDFVVAWINFHYPTGGPFDDRVHARRFNLAGQPQGSEITVDKTTGAASDSQPKVAMDSLGNFVIAWGSFSFNQGGVYGQRFNSAGIPQGNVFRVDDPLQLSSSFSLAMDSRGDFVIAWRDFLIGGNVYAERFDSGGNPQGTPIQVGITTYSSQQQSPAVAMDSVGDFVVVWQQIIPLAGEPSIGIFAQRYDRSGNAQGGIIEVTKNDNNSNWESPSVAMNATGDFVVAWEALDRCSHLINGFARQYHSSGVAKGPDFLVSTSATSNSLSPNVAMDSKNNIAFVWTKFIAGKNDFSSRIYTRRFRQ
jgi:hypothetical protein